MSDLTELVARAMKQYIADDPYEEIREDYYHLAAEDVLKALSDAGYVIVPREPIDASIILKHRHNNGSPLWVVLADAGLDANVYWSIWQAMIKEFENGD